MASTTNELLSKLLSYEGELCLSIYMPTHRSHPDNLQDVTRYKSLIKSLEVSLFLKYSAKEVKQFLEPLEALILDKQLWNHTLDGLGIFCSPNFIETVYLPISVQELAIAADSFHTKPLRKYLQSTDNYYVLALSNQSFHLFEGNRFALHAVNLPDDVPVTITEVLGEEFTEKHTTVASYGGTSGESGAMRHGHGSKKDEIDNDTEKFFRAVAKTIEERYSSPTGRPLILAALPEYHNIFFKVNKNALLLPIGIPINANALAIDKLTDMAWEIMEPAYISKLDSLVSQFNQEKANNKATDQIKEAAIAAIEGKIDTMIIEADRVIEGRITNLVTGNVQQKDINNPKVDDLLDDLGELVIKMGGKVVVVPAEKMPTETGLAAIFRY
jgi:phage baseplate assembly protein W